MIVPRARLLICVGAILLPLAALGAVAPATTALSAVIVAALLAIAVVDAFRSHEAFGGIRIELPEMVRLQKDRPGTFSARIHHESPAERLLRIGFAFPDEIVSEPEDRFVLLPANCPVSQLEWPVTADRRGRYVLEEVYLESISPLGLWAARTSRPARMELRVYPNLFAERKNVAALFLHRRQIGIHAQRMAGQGREFEKLREYVPGDSYDEIHWKASAKRGRPVTKVFQIERTQEVYVLVDASRLAARELTVDNVRTTVLERFVTGALLLGVAAEQQGDQFGLITFSDRVLSFVRARSGQAHFAACRDRLYGLQPQAVTPDFDEVCAFVRLRLRRRALLIFLTALDDPMLAENFTSATGLISRQHLIIADMLRPFGAHPLFSGEAVSNIDDLYRQLGGHLQWKSLRELENVLRRRGVRMAQLDPARVSAELVAQHAGIKRQQLL